MNRFGITFYGQHAIIKLTAKLDQENKDLMNLNYGQDLNIYSTVDKKGVERVRFEGCIEQKRFSEFLKEFKLAHKRTKLNALADEIHQMEHPELMYPQYDDEELPF